MDSEDLLYNNKFISTDVGGLSDDRSNLMDYLDQIDNDKNLLEIEQVKEQKKISEKKQQLINSGQSPANNNSNNNTSTGEIKYKETIINIDSRYRRKDNINIKNETVNTLQNLKISGENIETMYTIPDGTSIVSRLLEIELHDTELMNNYLVQSKIDRTVKNSFSLFQSLKVWTSLTRGGNYYPKDGLQTLSSDPVSLTPFQYNKNERPNVVSLPPYHAHNIQHKIKSIESSLNRFFFNIDIPYADPYVDGSNPLTYKSTIPNETIPDPDPVDESIPDSSDYISEGYNSFDLRYKKFLYKHKFYSIKTIFRNEIENQNLDINGDPQLPAIWKTDLRIETDEYIQFTDGDKIHLALKELLNDEELIFTEVSEKVYLNFEIDRTKFPELDNGIELLVYDTIESYYMYDNRKYFIKSLILSEIENDVVNYNLKIEMFNELVLPPIPNPPPDPPTEYSIKLFLTLYQEYDIAFPRIKLFFTIRLDEHELPEFPHIIGKTNKYQEYDPVIHFPPLPTLSFDPVLTYFFINMMTTYENLDKIRFTQLNHPYKDGDNISLKIDWKTNLTRIGGIIYRVFKEDQHTLKLFAHDKDGGLLDSNFGTEPYWGKCYIYVTLEYIDLDPNRKGIFVDTFPMIITQTAGDSIAENLCRTIKTTNKRDDDLIPDNPKAEDNFGNIIPFINNDENTMVNKVEHNSKYLTVKLHSEFNAHTNLYDVTGTNRLAQNFDPTSQNQPNFSDRVNFDNMIILNSSKNYFSVPLHFSKPLSPFQSIKDSKKLYIYHPNHGFSAPRNISGNILKITFTQYRVQPDDIEKDALILWTNINNLYQGEYIYINLNSEYPDFRLREKSYMIHSFEEYIIDTNYHRNNYHIDYVLKVCIVLGPNDIKPNDNEALSYSIINPEKTEFPTFTINSNMNVIKGFQKNTYTPFTVKLPDSLNEPDNTFILPQLNKTVDPKEKYISPLASFTIDDPTNPNLKNINQIEISNVGDVEYEISKVDELIVFNDGQSFNEIKHIIYMDNTIEHIITGIVSDTDPTLIENMNFPLEPGVPEHGRHATQYKDFDKNDPIFKIVFEMDKTTPPWKSKYDDDPLIMTDCDWQTSFNIHNYCTNTIDLNANMFFNSNINNSEPFEIVSLFHPTELNDDGSPLELYEVNALYVRFNRKALSYLKTYLSSDDENNSYHAVFDTETDPSTFKSDPDFWKLICGSQLVPGGFVRMPQIATEPEKHRFWKPSDSVWLRISLNTPFDIYDNPQYDITDRLVEGTQIKLNINNNSIDTNRHYIIYNIHHTIDEKFKNENDPTYLYEVADGVTFARDPLPASAPKNVTHYISTFDINTQIPHFNLNQLVCHPRNDVNKTTNINNTKKYKNYITVLNSSGFNRYEIEGKHQITVVNDSFYYITLSTMAKHSIFFGSNLRSEFYPESHQLDRFLHERSYGANEPNNHFKSYYFRYIYNTPPTITKLTIDNIPIEYINADHPTNLHRKNGYHKIKYVDQNHFEIICNSTDYKAFYHPSYNNTSSNQFNIVDKNIFKSVQVATTKHGDLQTAYKKGDIIDGYKLKSNDRILIKNQIDEKENGIYVVLDIREPVRVATLAPPPGTDLNVGLEVGDIIDGVKLQVRDRILVKDQQKFISYPIPAVPPEDVPAVTATFAGWWGVTFTFVLVPAIPTGFYRAATTGTLPMPGQTSGIYVINKIGRPSLALDNLPDTNMANIHVDVEEGTQNNNTTWECTNSLGDDIMESTQDIDFVQKTVDIYKPKRANDMPANSFAHNVYVEVENGIINKNTAWLCTSAITEDEVDVHDINFIKFNTSNEVNIIDYIQYPEYTSNTSIVVSIQKIDEILEGFKYGYHYVYEFGRIFEQVTKIELISSEFPNSAQVIRKIPVEFANNKLYWRLISDGTYTYEATLDPGNYSATTLATEMMDKMNRVVKSYDSQSFNECLVSLDSSKSLVEFRVFSKYSAANILFISKDSNRLEIKYETVDGHELESGDVVIISNSSGVGGISANVVNNEHLAYPITKTTFFVLLPTTATISQSYGGGRKTVIRKLIPMQLLWNYPHSFGDILGFNNVNNSETYIQPPFMKVVSNSAYNEYNNSDAPTIFDLSGQRYIFMQNELLSNVDNNSKVKNVFAKILLMSRAGSYSFNSFISSPKIFDNPLTKLSKLQFDFVDFYGNKYQFNGIEHSFSLKITEQVDSSIIKSISSRRNN